MRDKDLEERLRRFEERLEIVNFELGKLIGQQHTIEILVKYVVLPLIVIVGGLVGVDIAL